MAYDRRAVRLPGRGRHPLLKAIWKRRVKYSNLARALDVTPQAIAVWIKGCQRDRHFLLPAEQVPGLCRTLRVRPATLRPDLYEPKWSFR